MLHLVIAISNNADQLNARPLGAWPDSAVDHRAGLQVRPVQLRRCLLASLGRRQVPGIQPGSYGRRAVLSMASPHGMWPGTGPLECPSRPPALLSQQRQANVLLPTASLSPCVGHTVETIAVPGQETCENQ